MANRIAGTCYLKADGEQIEFNGDLTFNAQKYSKETITSNIGVAGYSESSVAPSLKITALYSKDLPIEKIQSSNNMTLTAELANGKVFTLAGAYLIGSAEVNATAGTIDLEFNGVNGILS